MRRFAAIMPVVFMLSACTIAKREFGDIRAVPVDLTVPPVTDGPPAPGKRVRMTCEDYAGTDVHHLVYLPTDWVEDEQYPVLVEYAGNGPYKNKFGDVSTGMVDGSNLGYGISGGKGFIWICMPYINSEGEQNERLWWGDLAKTVAYCKAALAHIVGRYGGDPTAILLAGFSRGAIACNFIGLHDDEIAQLWCGFICHSHYDGVHEWAYAGSKRESAARRLLRLRGRPQWISHEMSVEATRSYLAATGTRGRFTLRVLPFRNHTDTWVLRDVPLRAELRDWVQSTLRAR